MLPPSETQRRCSPHLGQEPLAPPPSTHLDLGHEGVDGSVQLLHLLGHFLFALLEPAHHLGEAAHPVLQAADLHQPVDATPSTARAQLATSCWRLNKARQLGVGGRSMGKGEGLMWAGFRGGDPPRLMLLPAEPHPNCLLYHDAGAGTIQDLVLYWRREGGGVREGQGEESVREGTNSQII